MHVTGTSHLFVVELNFIGKKQDMQIDGSLTEQVLHPLQGMQFLFESREYPMKHVWH